MKFYRRIINKLNCLYIKVRYRYVSFKNAVLYNISFENQGNHNTIEIGNHSSLRNCKFRFFGSNNHVIIGARTRLNDLTFWIGEDYNKISIGNDCWLLGGELAACEGTSILIGDNNMFSHSLLVRTSDSHSILDEKGNRINCAQDIIIGNHVWIGLQVLILKGVVISDNCIVGARSIVTSKSPHNNNCIILGAPAKIVKEGVSWNIDRL